MDIESFFDKDIMSVHLRENNFPFAKKGTPGSWAFKKTGNKKISQEEIIDLAKKIMESEDSSVEIDRHGSSIVQKGRIRIVITRPPLSDAWEITAVKPVRLLSLSEYKLSEKLSKRIKENAEGILVAGSPGQGKTTFARALAIDFAENGKVVKTVEAPRDLILPDNITQLALSHGSPEEVQDILLLARPDYTIFDEMRNTKDFMLFSDLRLSGVGMIGIVHATNPIDAIQRFIGKIELGVIPQIIDTVIFIRGGNINKVFEVKMAVKTPTGMIEKDLARPVVVVNDFETQKLEFEIYSYGDETVVVPVVAYKPEQSLEILERKLKKFSRNSKAEIDGDDFKVFIPEEEFQKIIALLPGIEKDLGIKLIAQKLPRNYTILKFSVMADKRHISLTPLEDASLKEVDIYADNSFVLSAKISKKNQIKISSDSEQGGKITAAIATGKEIEMRA